MTNTYRVVWFKSSGKLQATNNHLTRDGGNNLPLCGMPVTDANLRLCETGGKNDCRACQKIVNDNLEQCSQCKLWFPEYEPFDENTNRTHCEECGHDELRYNGNFYRCIGCGHSMDVRKVKPLDGIDEDGVMSHVSGKPALNPICIFCDQSGDTGDVKIESGSSYSGATRGIDFSQPPIIDHHDLSNLDRHAMRVQDDAWQTLKTYVTNSLASSLRGQGAAELYTALATLTGEPGIAELRTALEAVDARLRGPKLFPHQQVALEYLLQTQPKPVESRGTMQVVPLPVSYMDDAELLPPQFDSNGNAPGYLVLKFGNQGRADYWNGDCWVSFREFSVNEDFRKSVFRYPADAQSFIDNLRSTRAQLALSREQEIIEKCGDKHNNLDRCKHCGI